MHEAVSLSAVSKRFEEWRSSKAAGDKIPDELWVLARGLSGDYTPTQIARRLRLAGSQMRRHGLVSGSKTTVGLSTEKDGFVNVPLDSVLPSMKGSLDSTLVLTRADGAQLTLSQPSAEHFSLLINAFIGGITCCK